MGSVPRQWESQSFHASRRVVASYCLGVFLLACVLDHHLNKTGVLTFWDVHLLHLSRGPKPVPDKVVVAAFDQNSLYKLGLESSTFELDASLHVRLLDALTAARAKTVVYDIYFPPDLSHDEATAFANAIERQGSVLLFSALKRFPMIESQVENRENLNVYLEATEPPHRYLQRAARGDAPFPLPVQQHLSKVSLLRDNARNVETLPFLAFLLDAEASVQALLNEWVGVSQMTHREAGSFLSLYRTSLNQFVRHLYDWYQLQDGSEHERLSEKLNKHCEKAQTVSCESNQIHQVFSGSVDSFINFYGPPRAIPTVSVIDLLKPVSTWSAELRQLMKGSAVFVGFSSEFAATQKDSFSSVYSTEEGLNISGVEVAATVFSNLKHGSVLREVTPLKQGVIYLGWGVLCGVLLFFSMGKSFLLVLVCSVAYYVLVVVAFTKQSVVLPLVIPLFFLVPLAMLVAFAIRYLRTRSLQNQASEALNMLLPEAVLSKVGGSDEIHSPLLALKAFRRDVKAVVVMTDIIRYTSLTEQLENRDLAALMDEYYGEMFGAIVSHGGQILDAVGDGLFALFIHEDPEVAKHNALQAVLRMDARVFEKYGHRLETRFGIDFGEALMTNLGTHSKVEFRVVGDVVNTASRMDNLNKLLGTNILISEAAKPSGVATEPFDLRFVGNYLLAGKSQPTPVYELLGHKLSFEDSPRKINVEQFNVARTLFDEQRWGEARRAFVDYLSFYANDGPARFYSDQCLHWVNNAEVDSWPGYFITQKN